MHLLTGRDVCDVVIDKGRSKVTHKGPQRGLIPREIGDGCTRGFKLHGRSLYIKHTKSTEVLKVELPPSLRHVQKSECYGPSAVDGCIVQYILSQQIPLDKSPQRPEWTYSIKPILLQLAPQASHLDPPLPLILAILNQA